MKIKNPKKPRTLHARTEVLSVKVSPVEKYMIMMAARKMKISPSEFVRRVATGAGRNLGIEEPEVGQAWEPSSAQAKKGLPGEEGDGSTPVAA